MNFGFLLRDLSFCGVMSLGRCLSYLSAVWIELSDTQDFGERLILALRYAQGINALHSRAACEKNCVADDEFTDFLRAVRHSRG